METSKRLGHVETYLNVDFRSSAQVKIQFRTQKNQIWEFPCCSTREDLSIDASISTNVGLLLTKLRRFQHFDTSQNSNSNIFEKILIFAFPCCSTHEDL